MKTLWYCRGLYLLCFGFLLVNKTVYAQQARVVKVGEVAPPLTATADAKPVPAFEPGRVYVVEFWATWCGPCLASFDHLNGLVKAMSGKPVSFLSITNEDPVRTAKLLQTRRLDTQVVHDQNNQTFDRYGVKVIPHTVLIGMDGKVAAITNPQAVTETALRDLLAKRVVALPEKTNISPNLAWDEKIGTNTPEALTQVVVQRSNADSGALRFRRGSGHIVADGVGVSELIQAAYNAASYEVKNNLPDNKQRYRVSVVAPNASDEAARTLLQSVLPSLARFTAQWQEETGLVFILKRIPGTPEMIASNRKLDGFAQNGEIVYTGASMEQIASTLAGVILNTKVVDETGYKGTYDINLTWVPENTASLHKALKAKGFQLVQETRPVRFLHIEPVP